MDPHTTKALAFSILLQLRKRTPDQPLNTPLVLAKDPYLQAEEYYLTPKIY